MYMFGQRAVTEGPDLSSHDNSKRIIVTFIECLLYASPTLKLFMHYLTESH